MNVIIHPTPLRGNLSVISSKSLSHRYVIASSLAKGTSHVHHVLDSEDLVATKNALSHFGISFDGNRIDGGIKAFDQKEIDCHESGSTLRFMIPLAMLYDEDVIFTGHGRLPFRPLDVYKEVFAKQKLRFDQPVDRELPLTVKGPLRAGRFQVRGDVSSQFITGLLFALPLLNEDSVIELITPLESKGYIDLTLDVLKSFGIKILDVPPFYYIPGGQSYQVRESWIEGDYSQAAFFMVAGVLSGPITLTNLNLFSKQGDKAIIQVLQKMGAQLEIDEVNHQIKVFPSITNGIDIDLSDIPDLGPILMALASVSKGTTHFIHAKRLRAKESDRIDSMEKALRLLGVLVKSTEDEVWIEGTENLLGDVILDGCYDHRIVMALSILSIKAKGKITITGAEAIDKSYPTFFNDYRRLGGYIDES